MSQLDSTGLKRLHREWRRRGHPRLSLMLDRVQNPLNMGSVVRTASAERVEHLYLIESASPDSPKAAKTAIGTERYIAWSAFGDAASAMAAARSDGYRIVAVELASGARPLHELDLTGAVALALGNENHGLSAAVLEGCDAVGFIPQLGRVGSLNVAAATAIAVYEARRQQWTQGPARTSMT
ncbi:MAG: RNA methyltransferase [Acidimicrobiaceae bacterium]|nr:RNA methyltransferase [Acidimicrobiaceae bacterium]